MSLQQLVRTLTEPTIHRLGFDLIAVEWTGGRTGPLLRLSIDGRDHKGVTAEDCARVSETISPLLDASDPIPSRYTLEVSSPGIERPVQRREDFERFLGFRIKIRLHEGPPRRRYTGVLGPLDGDDVIVVVDGVEHRIALEDIERANLDLDLDEYRKLGETP